MEAQFHQKASLHLRVLKLQIWIRFMCLYQSLALDPELNTGRGQSLQVVGRMVRTLEAFVDAIERLEAHLVRSLATSASPVAEFVTFQCWGRLKCLLENKNLHHLLCHSIFSAWQSGKHI